MGLSFKTYLEQEIVRLSDGETSFEKQCRLLFDTQPRLEVPLLLSALCDSQETANALIEYVSKISLPEEQEVHRQHVLNNWKQLLFDIQQYSDLEIKELLKNADGDEMEKIGFSIPYAKYADTWFFWRNREVLDQRLNDTYRKKYQRLLESDMLTLDECIDIFDENFPRFIKGEFDYSVEVLKTFDL